MKSYMQRFGKSMLMPISTLAAAGIFLGLAAALQNPEIVGSNIIKIQNFQNFVGLIRKLTGLLFGNLSLFFCISIAAGMSDDEKPTAIYASIIGFMAFHLTLNYMLALDGINQSNTAVNYLMNTKSMNEIEANLISSKYEVVLGFFTYRMNVFGGIIVGLVVSALHNKFYRVSLPSSINFFGGKRFIPIITLITIPLVALISYFVWPFMDEIIEKFGRLIEYTGVFGTFIYGFLNRLLIPTGLHHILNQLVRFTPIGGSATIDNKIIFGSLNVFNEMLVSTGPISTEVMKEATKFIGQGHMIISMFGLTGASLAMYKNSKIENKIGIKALLLAGITSSILTGITEPIEFAFIFISPLLFIFHSIMTGLSYLSTNIIGTYVGGVQGGLIDLIVFGILRGTVTKWYLIPVIGSVFFIIYYLVFDYIIKKYDVKTPGREEEQAEDILKNTTLAKDEILEIILMSIGGKDNIVSIDNCFTRLRLILNDTSLIEIENLKKTGCSGISIIDKNNVQIIYGLKVEKIASQLKQYIKG